jgi:flagellar protein FliS
MQTPLTHRRAQAAYVNAADTMAPGRQILLLYDGAIRRLEAARAAIDAGRIEARYHAVMKAYGIIDALRGCLDFDAGGELAPMLDRFYGYVLHRLCALNVANDPGICDELIGLLRTMRASWAEIGDSAAGSAPHPARSAQALPAA